MTDSGTVKAAVIAAVASLVLGAAGLVANRQHDEYVAEIEVKQKIRELYPAFQSAELEVEQIDRKYEKITRYAPESKTVGPAERKRCGETVFIPCYRLNQEAYSSDVINQVIPLRQPAIAAQARLKQASIALKSYAPTEMDNALDDLVDAREQHSFSLTDFELTSVFRRETNDQSTRAAREALDVEFSKAVDTSSQWSVPSWW